MSKFEYVKLADAVAAEIADGSLKPGDRLPPQRTFAYERKIATSTASRVYTELLRRGLGSAKWDGARSFPEKRGAHSRSERTARGPHRFRIQLPAAADPIGIDCNKPAGPGQAGNARCLAETIDQYRNASCPKCRCGFSCPSKLVSKSEATGVHRQRPAMHCSRARRGGADRRPLRRRGADLPFHQGHRRPARRDAGAIGDG